MTLNTPRPWPTANGLRVRIWASSPPYDRDWTSCAKPDESHSSGSRGTRETSATSAQIAMLTAVLQDNSNYGRGGDW
eukprot:13400074-Heterocapsa_arctica.AAC.1